MILYHGTNTKRLPSIKKQGLLPTAPKASMGDNFVYLTDNPEVAALFSGFGRDSQGFHREGYMTSLEARRQTGVVLKVNVDKKYLEKDQIWDKKLKELKDPKLYHKIYDEILKDYQSGNQVLDFQVERELHKIWKDSDTDFDYNPDSMQPEDIDYAVDVVVKRLADKEVKSLKDETKHFTSGKLYQYSRPIPSRDIIDILPAKDYLKNKDTGKDFGKNMELHDPFKVSGKVKKMSFINKIQSQYRVTSLSQAEKLETIVNNMINDINFTRSLPDLISAAKANILIGHTQHQPGMIKISSLALAFYEAAHKKDEGAAYNAVDALVKSGYGEIFGLK